MKRKAIIICLIFLPFICVAQSIYQSKEINVRNDVYYDILKVGSKNLVLRAKSNAYVVEKFNSELQYEGSTNIQLEDTKTEIISAVDLDSIFQIFYSYRDEQGNYTVRCIDYNENVEKIDTSVLLISTPIKLVDRTFKFTTSQNKLFSLLFGIQGNEINLTLFDNKTKKIEYSSNFEFSGFDISDDFRRIIPTNEGKIYIVFEKGNTKFRRETHVLGIYEILDEMNVTYKEISLRNTVNSGIQVVYNKFNSSLIIAGFFAEKDVDELIGYFVYRSSILDSLENELLFSNFDEAIFEDLYGKRSRRRQTSISDFYLKDIVLRQDNGCLLISEMSRQFIRRSSYSNVSGYDGNGYAGGGFVDYYNEDLLLINLNRKGDEEWNRLFYKKQFSQDDRAIYSSYFLIKTPSRLRFIYNDEIKKNSTVSEYVISPTGKFERNAIINTEYRGLQLRFTNAKQIGSNELIVPSEKDFRLSLVKLRLD